MSFKTSKILSYLFYFGAVALLVYSRDDGTHFPVYVWVIPLLIGVVIQAMFSKCPGCGKQLSNSMFMKKCPSCGCDLYGDGSDAKSGKSSEKSKNAKKR